MVRTAIHIPCRATQVPTGKMGRWQRVWGRGKEGLPPIATDSGESLQLNTAPASPTESNAHS